MDRLVGAVLAMSMLGFSGCGSGADCDKVGAHVAKLVDNDKAGKAKISEACRLGKWDHAVRSCLVGARDQDAVEECMHKLPEFVSYEAKLKTSEARELVEKLYRGAAEYYLSEAMSADSLTIVPAQFPNSSVGPTPALGSCCKQGGRCQPDPALWQAPVWQALQFSVDDPHYYSYQYEVIDKRKKFVVRAFGDLDCDGEYSTFAWTGVVNDGMDVPERSGELVRERELE